MEGTAVEAPQYEPGLQGFGFTEPGEKGEPVTDLCDIPRTEGHVLARQ